MHRSLKTGGVGLNLAAADCVFHVDPWWNPAIEDQASDGPIPSGGPNPVRFAQLTRGVWRMRRH